MSGTGPRRRDDLRFPDGRPLRRIQLATLGLIALVAVLTLTSGSRPAEVRWGTLAGLAVLTVLVLVTTRRRRARRAAVGEENNQKPGDIEERNGGTG